MNIRIMEEVSGKMFSDSKHTWRDTNVYQHAVEVHNQAAILPLMAVDTKGLKPLKLSHCFLVFCETSQPNLCCLELYILIYIIVQIN